MWGISRKKIYRPSSYQEVWGITKWHHQWYPKNDKIRISTHNKCDKSRFAELENGEVDILLDVDKRTLNICVVGKFSIDQDAKIWIDKEAKIWDIEINEDGWVPYFNCYSPSTKLQITQIPNNWYGLSKEIGWNQS